MSQSSSSSLTGPSLHERIFFRKKNSFSMRVHKRTFTDVVATGAGAAGAVVVLPVFDVVVAVAVFVCLPVAVV